MTLLTHAVKILVLLFFFPDGLSSIFLTSPHTQGLQQHLMNLENPMKVMTDCEKLSCAGGLLNRMPFVSAMFSRQWSRGANLGFKHVDESNRERKVGKPCVPWL